MTTIKKSIVINAPVEHVEAILDDPTRLPDWYAGISAAKADPGFPAEIGSANHLTYKAAGITFDTKLTTSEFIPHRQRTFKLEGMITGTNRWELISEGDTSRVELTIDYEMPGGGVGKIADRLFVERTNDKNAEKSLANLKEQVERG